MERRQLEALSYLFDAACFGGGGGGGRDDNEQTDCFAGFGEVFDDSELTLSSSSSSGGGEGWRYRENEREQRFESGTERCERNRRTNPEETRRVVVRASEFRV